MMDLQAVVKELLVFGPPCEGSFQYHQAWKNLKDAYDELQKEKDNGKKEETNKKVPHE